VKKSGLLVREFPQELLTGERRIVSLAALMSVERTKSEGAGLVRSKIEGEGLEQLPLIYEVMSAIIKAGKARSSEDFIRKYLIGGYLDAIERCVFLEGITIEPHSQNLCMVFNEDLIPQGFAYRDHGGIWVDISTRALLGKDIGEFQKDSLDGDSNRMFKAGGAVQSGYTSSFSWFYQYQVFTKLLNTITTVDAALESRVAKLFSPMPGASYQIGDEGSKLKERFLHGYIVKQLSREGALGGDIALRSLKKLSLQFNSYGALRQVVDRCYRQLMNRYFDMHKVGLELEDGFLPSVEGGSGHEELYLRHSGFFGRHRFSKILSARHYGIHHFPKEKVEDLERRLLSSFKSASFDSLELVEFVINHNGIYFFNAEGDVKAFLAYIDDTEREMMGAHVSAIRVD
jgi:hypothetical protein